MKSIIRFVLSVCFALLVPIAIAAPPQTINYQGYLTSPGGTPVNATVPMTFRLYNAFTGGSMVWSEAQPSVLVSNGNFNVMLGAVAPVSAAFDVPYWLSVQVGADPEMSPRQPLASSPYAFNAMSAASVAAGATIAGSQITGTLTTAQIADAAVTAAKGGTGINTAATPAQSLLRTTGTGSWGTLPAGAEGQVLKIVGGIVAWGTDSTGLGGVTSITAGAGLTGGTITGIGTIAVDPTSATFTGNFLRQGGNAFGAAAIFGTTDNQPVVINTNGSGALRIYPNASSPNLIGGYSGNTITPATVYGATIAGGGAFFYENRVMNTFGTVGGGRANHADGYGSTIAGGIDNKATGDYATVAGGLNNQATGNSAGIGGGFYNIASGYVAYIGGGDLNEATTQNATIGGGYNNQATGGQLIANVTIGGGVFNIASGFAATIAGGHGNHAEGEWSSMGGGGFNIASGARSATVSGGEYNIASGTGSTIGGGGWNGSASGGNQTKGVASTIGGGFGNLIEADGGYGTIGGGQQNQIAAPAGTNLNIGTIAGGYNNKITLGGGTVGGGNSNTVGNFDATVAGGIGNTASGRSSVVPGGISNLAQGYSSFAAGRRAKANNDGCFAWADSNDFDFACGLNNAFTARATGGVYFVTAINGAGANTAGVQVAAGGNAWSALSDRNSKTNFAAVDAVAIVERLARIPISTWNYKTQEAAIRHIGPMAQDFAAAFSLGEDETHISTIDADGISLAAIQGLYQIVQEKNQRISQLEVELKTQGAVLNKQHIDLEARATALERELQTIKSLLAGKNSIQ